MPANWGTAMVGRNPARINPRESQGSRRQADWAVLLLSISSTNRSKR